MVEPQGNGGGVGGGRTKGKSEEKGMEGYTPKSSLQGMEVGWEEKLLKGG